MLKNAKVSEINRHAIWPAIIAGGAAIIGGVIASRGASKAADAGEDAAEAAAQAQLEMYYQTREDLAPYREAGAWALGTPGRSASDVTNQLNALYAQRDNLRSQSARNVTPRNVRKRTQGVNALVSEYPNPFGPEGFGAEFGDTQWDAWVPGTPYPTGAPMPGTAFSQIGRGASATGTDNNELNEINRQIAELEALGEGDIEGTGLTGMIERGPGEFEESPGYRFTLKEGLDAQQNALSAMGKNRSGTHLKAAAAYAEGMASTEYDNFLARWYKSLTPYQSMAGLGMTGAQTTSQAGTNAATGAANAILAGGIAKGAGYINQANALTGAIGTGANALLQYNANRNLPQTGYQPYQAGQPNFTGRPVDQWRYSG